MAGSFGVSFLPGSQNQQNGTGMSGRPASQSPMQEAVKILSLRLPKFYGSQSLAPAPLLQAAGGMGQPAARGNVTAQALAGLAGLPPSMALPQMAAPVLPSGGGGTETTSGWASRERDINRPLAPATEPNQSLFDGGTGFNPIPSQPPPPRFIPGSETGGGEGLSWTPPPEPERVSNPWENPKRNQSLANKYLDDPFFASLLEY